MRSKINLKQFKEMVYSDQIKWILSSTAAQLLPTNNGMLIDKENDLIVIYYKVDGKIVSFIAELYSNFRNKQEMEILAEKALNNHN